MLTLKKAHILARRLIARDLLPSCKVYKLAVDCWKYCDCYGSWNVTYYCVLNMAAILISKGGGGGGGTYSVVL